MEPRFYANGKRISRDEFETLELRGSMHGRVSCMWTRGVQYPGGMIRRTNGKTVQWES